MNEVRTLRIGLAQVNTTVGDLDGNAAKIVRALDQARSLGVDLIAFPELAISGYPPEDLLLKPNFVKGNQHRLAEIVSHTRGIAAVIGFVHADEDIYNAAAVAVDGGLVGVHHKNYLPTYGVFDEDRYFQAGRNSDVYVIRQINVGVTICEDIWHPTGPVAAQSAAGADLIVNISASPYHAGKRHFRERMLATRAADYLVIVAAVNAVGGQDELVFDGGSMVFDQRGELVRRGGQFEEELLVVDLDVEGVLRTRLHDPRKRKERRDMVAAAKRIVAPPMPFSSGKPIVVEQDGQVYDGAAEIYKALIVGTRDYVRKNGFQKVIIGLSGGIDSSLTAAIAADALGGSNVIGVTMRSRFTSQASIEDAEALARHLGIQLLDIPIGPAFEAYLKMLAPTFEGTATGVAEENMQARIRGNLLMAISNKFGHLVLTTGNKSEMAVGYSTLYGDMAGGFAVIKDVFKTVVFELARYRNSMGEVIPQRVLEREPTAELRADQRDTDTLPPYEVLDPILRAYVEEDRGLEEIVALGFDEETVRRAIEMVDHSEYKRRQSPPGIKITPRAFGRDRRLPLTNAFHDWRSAISSQDRHDYRPSGGRNLPPLTGARGSDLQ